jgi:hypothetical protein
MAYKLIDPLAQTFFIETPSVVTKVDLYFSAKDSALPAHLAIRKNQDGKPGPYIVPFSDVFVYPGSVSTSANANVATTVSFSSPVYLDIGEYSITLGSDSKNYRVYVSELDGIDTVTSKRITEQPYIGTLYKSQNAAAWSPVQTEDLKFKLYRAVFNTNSTGSITFTPDLTPYNTKVLEKDPLEVFPGSSALRVYHFNHGLTDGGYVVLNGVANAKIFGNVVNSFYGISSNLFEDVQLTVSNVTLSSYTVNLGTVSTATRATRFGGTGVYATQDTQIDTIYPVISSVNQGRSTITPSFKATSTGYTVDSSYTKMILGDNDLPATKLIAGNATTRYNLSNAQSFFYKLDLTTDNPYVAPLIDTKQLGLVLAKNLVDSPTYANKNLTYDIGTVTSASTTANLIQLSGAYGRLNFVAAGDISNATLITNGTYINITGTNPNNGQYRVVDVIDSGANVLVVNLSANIVTDLSVSNTYTITNGTKFIAEEAATGGSVYSKYITRQIDFTNDSTSLNLRIDVCKPTDATVTFYYKIKELGETEILSDQEFIEITNVTVPTSLAGEFYEVEKQLDSLLPFNAVVFKAVFKSTNTAQVPKLKNLRLIALA